MSQLPMMPLWTDAYLADTLHLTTEQHGAYLLLLMATWRNNGQPLPDDDKRLARTVRMTLNKWHHVRPIIEEFFTIDEKGWHQKRLENEWKASQKLAEVSRKNGARGGRPSGSKQTKQETQQVSVAKPRQNPDHNLTNHHLLTEDDEDLSYLVEDVPDGKDSIPVGPLKNSEHKNGQRPGRKLEETWQPSPDDIAYAADRGIIAGKLDDEIANFVEHFTNGNGRNKTSPNWSLRWQRWCRTAADGTASFQTSNATRCNGGTDRFTAGLIAWRDAKNRRGQDH